MAISNQTIISRMLRELESLQEKTPSPKELNHSIENVKLMCELLLENGTEDSGSVYTRSRSHQPASNKGIPADPSQTSAMTEEEYNVMIKGSGASKKAKPDGENKTPPSNDETSHDEANGESLFDF